MKYESDGVIWLENGTMDEQKTGNQQTDQHHIRTAKCVRSDRKGSALVF